MSFRNWLADFLEALGGAAQEELDASSAKSLDDKELIVLHDNGMRLDNGDPYYAPLGIELSEDTSTRAD